MHPITLGPCSSSARARLWLAALKRAAELKVRSASEVAVAAGVEDGSDPADTLTAEKEGAALGPLAPLHFTPLSVPAPNPRLVDVGAHAGDFEGARELFKLGSARILRAKATFVLDGFVTMHFEVRAQRGGLQDRSLGEGSVEGPRGRAPWVGSGAAPPSACGLSGMRDIATRGAACPCARLAAPIAFRAPPAPWLLPAACCLALVGHALPL